MTSFSNANDLYRFAVGWLLKKGELCAPRDMPVLEILNVQFKLEDPLQSIIGLRGRRLNYHFMVGEAMWMLCGLNRADLIEPFNRNIVMALDPGHQIFQGAYGPKITDQLPYIIDILRHDRDSRQAVLTIWRERPYPSKDVPCTVMMQFIIREDRLHMHVYMRSNDVWLGLPYDIFNFTMVQQVVAHLVNAQLGTYTHTVGSFHLYERNVNAAKLMMEDPVVALHTMPRVLDVPLDIVTAAYAEIAVQGNTGDLRPSAWLSKWISALQRRTPDVRPWVDFLYVLAHRFDDKIKTHWDDLFEVGR